MINLKRARTVAGVAAVAALASGCSNYLTTPDALNNPNSPTSASNQQRITGVETNLNALLTGDIARTISMFMNQFAGTDRQYSAYSLYQVGEDFTNGGFSTIYGGGGVIDLHGVEASADASGDSTTAGIARILEAMEMGTAADFWGDVPYTTAFDPSTKAKLDPQASIYAAVQTLLDRGIKQLASASGAGPGAADLFYNGDRTKWTQAAYTLKARYLLHTAERAGFSAVDGTPNFDAATYTAAIAAANNGIASTANNLRTYQSAAQTESNLLYQFIVQNRAGYMAPGKFLVDLMNSRSDPRLATYFATNSAGNYVGAVSGGTGGPAATVSAFNTGTGGIASAGYRWPLVSYSENQLIIAEAQYRTGNPAAALIAYNNERTSAGLAASTLPTGAAGLQEIMTEKYIALVQNPEVWNDYKRTCFPVLTPNGVAANQIFSRFYYPDAERNANPDNIPVVGNQPPRNPNDPNPCFNGARQVTL